MKKKILIICTTPITFTSIIKDQVAYINNHLNVSVASSEKEKIRNYSKENGVRYYHLETKRKISIINDIKSVYNGIKIILKEKPDIVHTYTPKAGLIGMLASFITRVPIRIHTFTGLIFPHRKGLLKKTLKLSDKLVSLLSTTIIAEGKGIKLELIKNKITKKRKIKIIGNGNIVGINTNHFKREKPYGKNEKFIFTFIGRMNEEKGISEIIEASIELKKSHNIELWLIGEEEHINKKNKDEIYKNTFIKQFTHQDDIRPYLNCTDILLLPSYREGFPNIILQACSMEIPVIASNITGCNEIIKNELNGWLCQPKCSKSLYEKMLIAIEKDTRELKKMGQEGRNKVKKDYEEEDYRKKLISFYLGLLS